MKYEEIFCYDNFFSNEELISIEKIIDSKLPGQDAIHPYGPFSNQLIANYIELEEEVLKLSWFKEKISSTVARPFEIVSVTRVKLFLPWDIHSDYFLNECHADHYPYYNFLIPLEAAPSRTIIFDQTTSSSPNFSDYKDHNDPVDHPPSQEFWEDNLSMCWPQDRQYVTVKKIMPWQQRGQLQGFPSNHFHSSDNFHLRMSEPKSFIQVRTSTKK